MQSAIQPYYTISGLVLLQQYQQDTPAIKNTTGLNIVLDMPASQLSGLLTLVNTLENNFLFSLPATVAADANLVKTFLPSCYLLASSSRYTAQEDPVIPILRSDPASTAAPNTGMLVNYCKKQGIENMKFPVFHYGGHQQAAQHAGDCSYYTYNTASRNSIEASGINTIFIDFVPGIKELTAFDNQVRQAATIIKIELPEAGFISKKIVDREMQHWQKRALLYRYFIQLGKSVQEKEYYEVLDWYRKEYEVLPLWYKRFGHIIKVLMGKRTVRSLFSDNVKKHKD